MKFFSSTLLVMSLITAASAHAEGGSDRLIERSDALAQQRTATTENTAQQEKLKRERQVSGINANPKESQDQEKAHVKTSVN